MEQAVAEQPGAPVTVEELLIAGTHFGHLTRRWNPKMRDYIFMERNGIHIIDLRQTQRMLTEAADAASRFARRGQNLLFVGTKKQAQETVKREAERCGMPYVTERWLGGMLTNFQTIRLSIRRMENLVKMEEDGTFEQLKKKERLMRIREREKLERTLFGISKMPRVPNAIFVVDIGREHIAVLEAQKLGIPIIAMVDTNCNPEEVEYPIPANDDALKSIQLTTRVIADAVLQGKKAGEIDASTRKAETEKRKQETSDEQAEEASES